MKFVALISGGKDSFFNIYHCLSRGHELVALANLYPRQADTDEIDSYMFQTVGHDIVELYEQCLNVPLYREQIKGTSSNQNLEYSVTQEDEIEDLYRLLCRVKLEHPDIKGVSCGAILSHYQRTRVENVCGRLLLTSLSYLWQRDQLELLQEMCDNNLDARLIKVAAIGLEPDSLGKSLSEMLPTLITLNSTYDVHICGEGGEFETIVLDAPYFKKRLELVDSQISQDGDVAYLKVKAKVIDKENVSFKLLDPPPNVLDADFTDIYSCLASTSTSNESTNITFNKIDTLPSITSTKTKLYVSNLTSQKSTIEEQTTDIFHELTAILQKYNSSLDNIQHVTLLLSDILNFEKINGIYEQAFKKYFLPPSRICVETSLSTLVHFSCIVLKHQGIKKGLHVQSRSYWAPQNIGPYSQSVIEELSTYKIGTLSGQIPLIPSTMELSRGNIRFNSVLSLQHLFKVKSLINLRNYAFVIAFITNKENLSTVCKTWELAQLNGKQLLIVQVQALPKKADVEWGGICYENIIDMYDDESLVNQLSDQQADIIRSFEQHYSTVIGKGALHIVVLFTNDFEKIKRVLENNTDSIQLFTNHSKKYHNCEVVPVLHTFNFEGIQFKYGVIWKIEINN
ncbi:uncharacterized protein PRCAT00005939001 [Priceomyces carsonii]|uniref:uncharacterized protein n=1 Tax=Priceomyces carsonii TaxID=28549 RepID=UPI002ED9086B|nr:unnamed protein product [Priceomyces carsonii]